MNVWKRMNIYSNAQTKLSTKHSEFKLMVYYNHCLISLTSVLSITFLSLDIKDINMRVI